jgi:hypothetical protein
MTQQLNIGDISMAYGGLAGFSPPNSAQQRCSRWTYGEDGGKKCQVKVACLYLYHHGFTVVIRIPGNHRRTPDVLASGSASEFLISSLEHQEKKKGERFFPHPANPDSRVKQGSERATHHHQAPKPENPRRHRGCCSSSQRQPS